MKTDSPLDTNESVLSSGENQKTLLLVEDEVLIAVTQSMKLEEYGYKVIHVQKGQKAIDAVNNGYGIDLILMDINLGEKLDGTDIAKIILDNHDIPLLFLSNHIERDIVRKTENITSYGYVVKETGITVLDASIKMAFRLHEAKNESDSKKQKLAALEKRYRRLFETAKDGILILNAENGMIVDVNPFIVNLLGYTKEQFLTKHIWDIGAKEDVYLSKQLFQDLQEKEYVRYEDLPLEAIDGKQTHVEFVSNVYMVDNEKVIQCNIRDITLRVIEEKVITDDNDFKDALLKEIQHRTKNSFAMITSLIHIRSEHTFSEEAKTILEDLTLRVKSISDLYTVLYETDSFHKVQIIPYFVKVIESMLNLSKNISVRKNIENLTVLSSFAATIGMILVELLSNIIKYAFPDSNNGHINIELKKTDFNILLLVEDNGIGMAENFDISNVKSVGLHLVNLMVSQLDGKIQFIPGNGTKIIIEIPL